MQKQLYLEQTHQEIILCIFLISLKGRNLIIGYLDLRFFRQLPENHTCVCKLCCCLFSSLLLKFVPSAFMFLCFKETIKKKKGAGSGYFDFLQPRQGAHVYFLTGLINISGVLRSPQGRDDYEEMMMLHQCHLNDAREAQYCKAQG